MQTLQATQRASMRPSLAQRPKPFQLARPARLVAVKASADDDAELEKRLEKLRLAKGATPYGQGSKVAAKEAEPEKKAAKTASKRTYDYSAEKLYYEGAPHGGDLAVNLALGTTLIWLPLTLAAVGRAAFVKYRFTDMRLSVITTAPWKNEQLDAAYAEVKSVRTVGRGIGLWGDMVVELRDGSKVEMRSVDRFRELEKYILQRRDELVGPSTDLTQAQLLGDEPAAPKAKADRKGFA